ncbi:MAG TPA: site-2 protease family protein [Anaerolineaceae bacterium]|nr:site-2 protease family protein [Anaerolineaceae bacterium]HQN04798.1 site-2 protease family protein [Anaerolineaceae bacterium]HQP08521.1 site-2 protease family protein [Anaerolineaceae bacterium]
MSALYHRDIISPAQEENSMLGLGIPTLITRLITLVIAFSVHEFSHAWTANAFGDSTPKNAGRLTLNPLKHLDPMGTLVLIFAGFGWAKPVPVNPYALERRSSSALMWVSLAGPLSNFVLAILASIPLRLNWVPYNSSSALLPSPYMFLVEFISINLLLMVFNLIPLAPLDGDKIVEYFLPESWNRAFNRIRPYSAFILLVVVFVLPMLGFDLLGWIIRPVMQNLFNLLMGYPV